MKKLVAALILLVLALFGIGYLYYTSWRSEVQTSADIPYIPQSAALVYEVEAAGQQWAAFQQTTIAQDLSHLPLWVAIQEGLSFLEGLGVDKGALDALPLVTSVHGLSEEEVGCIFYFNTYRKDTQATLLQLLSKVRQLNAYSIEERKYAGHTITVIGNRTLPKQLYFIKQGHYLMASFSSLLIEDVVRGLAHKGSVAFLALKKTLHKQGSVYVNFNKLPQLLRIFLQSDYAHSLGPMLATFASAAQLEVKSTSHHLLLNGFTTNPDTMQLNFVQTLAGQGAGPLRLAAYIPQRTAFLQHFTLSDATQLAAAFQQHRQVHQPSKEVEKLAQAAPSSLAAALDPLVDGELGLCTLGDHQKEQLLFIRVNHTEALIAALEELQLLSKPLPQQPSHLSTVYQVMPGWFHDWLPSELFPAFQAHCLMILDRYLVLANSNTAVETLGQQYLQGKTWANMLPQQRFLSSVLAQAHFSLLVNLQQAWPLLLSALKPAWKEFFETHATSLQKFEQASLQLVHEKQDINTCYLSLLVQHSKEPQAEPAPQEVPIPAVQRFQAEAPIITKPFVVRTHKSTALHTLLQDALHQVYFLDGTGKSIWKKALEGPIVTDVWVVDFYKNNKLQYLFATSDSLHLIDSNGKPVAQYPHKLPNPSETMGLGVVDYAGDKNYRFLIADAQGNIYLRDRHYRPLPGWNPRVLHSSFAAIPFHLRINRDYFFVLHEKGGIQVFNRKGQNYPGFPIDLEETTHNPLVVKKGNTAANTLLITLTDEGKLSFHNLAGTLQNTIQLDKPESTTRFTLCSNEATGYSYTIMRQDLDKLAILDEAGKVLFEKDHEAAQALLCQYYDFGEHKFYAITDPGQHQAYIYDAMGKALHTTPLPNSHPLKLDLAKTSRQLIVYSNFKDQALKYLLPING